MKIRNTISLLIIILVLSMCISACGNKSKGEIEEENEVTNEESQVKFNVDEFLGKISSDEYSGTNMIEIQLVRNYKEHIKVVEVKDNKILMEIDFNDGIIDISGKFNLIDGSNDYSMINKDGKYIDSDFNDVKYVINKNPSEDSIKNNIMNYADNKVFNTFNIDDFIFIPSIGENKITIKNIYSNEDSNSKRIITTKFSYIHKDKYFNIEGEISLVIKEVDEVSAPKIEINENSSKSLGTVPPNKEEMLDKIPDNLMLIGVSAKKLSMQEIDSINIVNIEMRAKLGMTKGAIIATYVDSDDNSEKNIEIPFQIVKKDNTYEINVDTTASYVI